MAIQKKYIIGKIPGYNKSILPVIDTTSAPGANKQELYTNRLLNNLNTIEFTPTSYKLKFDGDIAALVSLLYDASTNAASGEGVGTATNPFLQQLSDTANTALNTLSTAADKTTAATNVAAAVDSISTAVKNLSTQLLGKTIRVNRAVNTANWLMMLKYGICTREKTKSLSELLSHGFIVLGTNDSSFNEHLSNTYGINKFQEAAGEIGNKLKETPLGMVGSLMGYWKSMDSNAGLAGLQVQGKFGLLGALSGLVQGVKIELPQVWQNADYNSSLNIILKLISPSGDSKSIQRYIKDPLEILLRATAPVTFDGITFGYPMIWDVRAHGIMHMKLAAITALSITRGGNDTVFNKFEEPLNIDVRLMITPINPGFAQGPMADYSMTDPTDVLYSISSTHEQRNHEILTDHLMLNEHNMEIKKIMI